MRAVKGQRDEDGVVAAQDQDVERRHGTLSLPFVLILAALVRIPFVFLPPIFSDDVHRHRWDGRVLADGIDPYRFAPSSPALARLRDGDSAKINHRDVPTVYGPLAEGLLALLALSPAHASIGSIKALVAVFDLFAVASLFALGIEYGAGSLPALAYAVHPLAVIEGAGEGHLDGIAVALLLAALLALRRARGRPGALLFAAAGLVKLTPLAAAPAVFRAAGRKGVALIALALFLAHVPFLESGGPFRGLVTYARSWEANGAVYPELSALLTKTGTAERAKAGYAWLKALAGHPKAFDRGWSYFYTGFLARAILGAAFLLAAAWILKREPDAVRASGLLVTALLALSPTLHPWYLLNALPFALLFQWTSVAWVAGAAPLVYLTALPRGAVRAIEFLPALALFLLVDRRRST